MIQINLLPDVKQQFLIAQRNKRMVMGFSAIAVVAALAVTALLALHVYVNQTGHTARLQKDIDSTFAEFEAIPNINTLLTVREQLLELPTLHSQKPAATRLPGFLSKVVPKNIIINELSLDLVGNRLTLKGQGKDVIAINTFADVLKNTLFSNGDGNNPLRVFKNVAFEIGVQSEKTLGFDTNMEFDPAIFDITNNTVSLTVPNIVSTQSFIRSTSLFDVAPVVPVEEQ